MLIGFNDPQPSLKIAQIKSTGTVYISKHLNLGHLDKLVLHILQVLYTLCSNSGTEYEGLDNIIFDQILMQITECCITSN